MKDLSISAGGMAVLWKIDSFSENGVGGAGLARRSCPACPGADAFLGLEPVLDTAFFFSASLLRWTIRLTEGRRKKMAKASNPKFSNSHSIKIYCWGSSGNSSEASPPMLCRISVSAWIFFSL